MTRDDILKLNLKEGDIILICKKHTVTGIDPDDLINTLETASSGWMYNADIDLIKRYEDADIVEDSEPIPSIPVFIPLEEFQKQTLKTRNLYVLKTAQAFIQKDLEVPLELQEELKMYMSKPTEVSNS